MSYAYHAFISYRRGGDVETWVREFFVPELRKKLKETLGGEDPAIFVDTIDIRSGELWERKIAEGLRRSICLVPIWSSDYFTSRWCVSEWATFQERLRRLPPATSSCIVPVAWSRVGLPPAAAPIQGEDFSEFTITAPAFSAHPTYVTFEKLIRKFAGDAAQAIKNHCAFDPSWPVVVPKRRPYLDEYSPIELEELPNIGEMLVLFKPLIAQPNLAA